MPKSHVSATKPLSHAQKFQSALLGWYDRHARVLPWRAAKGKTADPYHVWMSEVMLQQTTVQTVAGYFEKFTSRWPTLSHLAQAETDDVMQAWAGLGYYARARNLLKCARAVHENHKGVFPQTEAELLNLPGIGPYTSAAIAAIAFNQQATVIDGNVERVVSRVALITDPLPASKPQIREQANILFQNVSRPGDFAQGMMDLGATICIPRTPRCSLCPVSEFCEAFKAGVQADLPAKAAKKVRPQRHGRVYWLKTKDGRIAYEKRPDDRMLGGMPGLPTTDWDKSGYEFDAGKLADPETPIFGTVYHTFTHFDLSLDIVCGTFTPALEKRGGNWMFCVESDIKKVGFPTVFGKVIKYMTAPDKT